MYYKFLHSRDLHKVLEDETILLGSLSYYRSLETNNEWIADKKEGLTEVLASNLVLSNEKNELREKLVNSHQNLPFIVPNFTGEATINEIKYTYLAPESFIFSACWGPLPALYNAMCVDSVEPYDACLHISSMLMLKWLLYSYGWLDKFNCSFQSLFPLYNFRRVIYESPTINLDQFPEAKIFAPEGNIKDPLFRSQSEVRYIFPFNANVFNEAQIVVRVPGIKEIFKPISLPPKPF